MDADLWKRFKMIAILNEMEVSELVEQALREKLERMKQLEQYPEYKDVRNVRVHKGEQTPPRQHDDTVIHSARYEAAKSDSGNPQQQRSEKSDIFDKDTIFPKENIKHDLFPLRMAGLKFPINRTELIDFAKHTDEIQGHNSATTPKGYRENPGFYYPIFKDFPDKIYTNKADLERVIRNSPLKDRYPMDLVLLITREDYEKYYGVLNKKRIDKEFEKVDNYFEEVNKQSQTHSQKGSLEYSVQLPGLKFPATKDEILECVKKVHYPKGNLETLKITIDILKQLPDDKYTGKNKLEKDYSNILRRKLKHLREYEGRIVTIIYDEPISTEQGQKQPSTAQLGKA
jgi:hypothetical protein